RGMQGLATTERAVAKVTPVLALVEAYHVGTDGAYSQGFARGSLLTVAYPLPTTGLPVEDGSCQDLAGQARRDYGLVTASAVAGTGGHTSIGKQAGALLGDAVATLLTPLDGILCGGSTNVDTVRLSTSCAECRRRGARSFWHGTRVVTADGHSEPGA